MSVRIVRTRNNEDVICDLYEVTTKDEPEKPIAFQMSNPYSVWIDSAESPMDLVNDSGEEISKKSDPNIVFEPWAPLAKDRKILLKLEEVVSAYETYPEVIEKYNKLMEAVNGRDTDQTDPTEGQT